MATVLFILMFVVGPIIATVGGKHLDDTYKGE